MPEYVPVLSLQELPPQGFKAVDVNGRSVLIGRAQNQLFACLDRCPHAAAPLRIGTLRGTELKCQRHGWIFDVLTGESIPDDPACHLTQIPVRVEGSQVLILPPEIVS